MICNYSPLFDDECRSLPYVSFELGLTEKVDWQLKNLSEIKKTNKKNLEI